MSKFKNPFSKLKVKKVYINKKTGQATIILPKKQFPKGKFPKQLEVTW
jgi:hypothetical protein